MAGHDLPRFLGYEVAVLQADHKHDHRGHRSINAAIGPKVPIEVIRTKCSPYLHHGERIRRTERTVDTAFSIVAQFQAEFRGVAEYYKLAFNRHWLGRLHYVMERSLTKTLARKYRITVPQVLSTFPCRSGHRRLAAGQGHRVLPRHPHHQRSEGVVHRRPRPAGAGHAHEAAMPTPDRVRGTQAMATQRSGQPTGG